MSRRSLQSEAGFTLIEVLVALLIVVIAFGALATVFINGQGEASADVQSSQLIGLADQQLEQVRSSEEAEGFSDLAMSAAPTIPSVGTTIEQTWANPNSFVEPGAAPCGTASASYDAFEIANDYDDVNTSSTGPPYGTVPSNFVPWSGCSQSEPLEVITPSQSSAYPNPLVTVGGTEGTCGSTKITSPCSLTEGSATFNVYTYVTDTYVGCDTGSSGTGASVVCPSGVTAANPISSANPLNTATCAFPSTTLASTACADGRRVTVAVVPTTTAKLARVTPVYLSSIFTDPTPSGSAQGSSFGVTLGVGI